MSFPKNPDTVIVKNEFYPNGLSELDIYKYYIKNRHNLFNQIYNRDLILFIGTDINTTTVKRIDSKSETGYIRLTKDNYDEIITGRTLSIHSTMNGLENFGIIDIDGYHFNDNRKATKDIYEYLLKFSDIKKLDIRFTGKESFHIITYFDKKLKINDIKSKLMTYLNVPEILNKYGISYKRIPGKISLDLSPNKFKGGFISLYSLSIIGLKCMDISISELDSFNRDLAKIK